MPLKTYDEFYKKIIPLDTESAKQAKSVLKEFVEGELIPKMEELDSLFSNLYSKENYHGGSFYDNWRISEPIEFDLDLILKIPFDPL